MPFGIHVYFLLNLHTVTNPPQNIKQVRSYLRINAVDHLYPLVQLQGKFFKNVLLPKCKKAGFFFINIEICACKHITPRFHIYNVLGFGFRTFVIFYICSDSI